QPEYEPIARAGEPFLDDFGCLWKTAVDGLTGTVVGHPLEDWGAFAGWEPPDPGKCMGIGPIDWALEKAAYGARRAGGALLEGGLRHGHTFLQLCDLRGYQNLLYDFSDGEPNIWRLVEMVKQFNLAIVRRYLDIGVDVMSYPDDLGMQSGPMLSPSHFRAYIQPSYRELIGAARERGVLAHMHSDGDIRALAGDIAACGVDIINLQDMVNGIDFAAAEFGGKTCVELDIDRQSVTVFGTPQDIDRHVREATRAIGSKQGGLMLIYGMYPGTPLANAGALMDAMERYAPLH
ncbi:MAG: hypothetical protein LBJ10_06650, partial [Clostridiales bacterium]|nr:hypothetical protein [Clostridiales bacterium]